MNSATVAEAIFRLVELQDTAEAEWETLFEAASKDASTVSKLSVDLDNAITAFSVTIAADAKSGAGPLAGLAVTSDAYKLALKDAVNKATHLTAVRTDLERAIVRRDASKVSEEIARQRMRTIETALKAYSSVARMIAAD